MSILEIDNIENEPIFIKDGVLNITDEKTRVKFLNELDKLRKQCVTKAEKLERILNNKVKVNINLNFDSHEGERNGDL